MKKDLAAKEMTKCADVFSDICNVNLFGSEQRLRPEELELLPTEQRYRDRNGNLREHRMDVRMRHHDSQI